MPNQTTHYVGVGGLVLNDEGKVLLIEEYRSQFDKTFWKIPGGMVDPGEKLGEACAREVLEETGIEAEVEGIIGIKEMLGYSFGRADLYVCFLLRAKGGELKPQESE